MLSLYTDYLLSTPKYATATGMSEALTSAIGQNEVTRFLAQSHFDLRTVWKATKSLTRQQVPVEDGHGVLILDDSVFEKPHTDESTMVCWHYDHSKGCPVKGINFMTLLYTHGECLSAPTGIGIIEKTGETKYRSVKTKNAYFRKMLLWAKQQVGFQVFFS